MDKLLLGLIGAGIGHSLTPAMHEAEGQAHGLRVHYQLIDLNRSADGALALPLLLTAARHMGFAGLNITYPCKQAVMPLLDTLSDEARAMAAVNTVVFKNGKSTGHNTDGSGWAWGFKRQLPQADLSHVVLLGAGGAGSAIAHALLRMGTPQLTLCDPDSARAAALAQRLQTLYPKQQTQHSTDLPAAMHTATGLVHATPTGMGPSPGMPLPAALLRRTLWVSEIVYFPLETPLLRAAREQGCAVSDGLGMVVGQAVDAFRLFTGLEPNAARMQAHVESLLDARSLAAT
jgi:shikimate dehydrogenase